MEEKVANWIIEFLLRKPIDDKIIDVVLSSLPLSKNDSRLKKTILLRKIESQITDGSVTENLLEFLEIIEELDHKEGKKASNLMKEAYCKVAVDCTVRYLKENDKYCGAVERFWRNRVCLVDGLASEESNRWMAEIEAAVLDSGICDSILMRNSRNEALKAVKSWLKEGWESLGPSFLELVAKMVGNEVEELPCSGGDACRELVTSQGTQNGPAFVRRKHIAMKSSRPRGVKISVVDKDAENSMNTAYDVPNRRKDKLLETVQSHSMQQHVTTNDVHLGASQVAHELSSPMIIDNMDNAMKNRRGPEIHATAEVNRVQYAHQSSSRALHAAVTDPLPEAFQLAETLSSTGATEYCDTAVGNQGVSEMQTTPKVDSVRLVPETNCVKVHAAVWNSIPDAVRGVENVSLKTTTINRNNYPASGNQTQPKVDVPRESTDKNFDALEKKDEATQGNVIQDPKEPQKRKRTIMDVNGTGHMLEWNDSIENLGRALPDATHLPPTPNRSTVSPLVQSYDLKFRRKWRRWTAHEENTLRDGVMKFGHSWVAIRSFYNEVFKDRSDVDLKDKWRNILKSRC